MAPLEAQHDDEQHAELAKDVGVPAEHEAFVLWRLTKHLGAGAFSKVCHYFFPKCTSALKRDQLYPGRV